MGRGMFYCGTDVRGGGCRVVSLVEGKGEGSCSGSFDIDGGLYVDGMGVWGGEWTWKWKWKWKAVSQLGLLSNQLWTDYML
jgi:hypothetical protein